MNLISTSLSDITSPTLVHSTAISRHKGTLHATDPSLLHLHHAPHESSAVIILKSLSPNKHILHFQQLAESPVFDPDRDSYTTQTGTMINSSELLSSGRKVVKSCASNISPTAGAIMSPRNNMPAVVQVIENCINVLAIANVFSRVSAVQVVLCNACAVCLLCKLNTFD